jgi:hypothetical protein
MTCGRPLKVLKLMSTSYHVKRSNKLRDKVDVLTYMQKKKKKACSLSVDTRKYQVKRSRLAFCSPCGGGVEYLHRSPAGRRRRQKGKSRNWESKIWSPVPRFSDPRMNALAKTSSNCKWQIHPLVRKDVISGVQSAGWLDMDSHES